MVLFLLQKSVTKKVLQLVQLPTGGGSTIRKLGLFTKPVQMSDTDTRQAAATPNNNGAPVSTTERDRCIFCRIIDGKDKASADKILFQDEEFVAFPDIRPATKHHLLIVTKEHIKDVKSLSPSQIGLLDRLVQTGQKVLVDQLNSEGASTDGVHEKTLMGFHWPPFHTVAHLHLHVIYPSDQIGFIGRIIFRPNSYWFVQPEWVRSRLEKLKDEGKS